MHRENDIIALYLTIDAACLAVTGGKKLRQRGPRPDLTDAEVLTIEIFGEMQGHHNDAEIWRYAKAHWQDWFPGLGSYPAFTKQSANLGWLKQQVLVHLFAPHDTIHLTDGVPMPICHLARANRSKLFRGEAAFGYCAAKGEHYSGFKGHVIINLKQQVVGFTLTPANVDERDVLDNVRGLLSGLLIGDKGLLSQAKQAELAQDRIDLQTPLRDNMTDPRPKNVVQRLLKTRRRIETVIGQLVEFFGLAACKARDLWHLTAKLARKLLAYNLASPKT
jgi:IS5 family transposase